MSINFHKVTKMLTFIITLYQILIINDFDKITLKFDIFTAIKHI